MKKVLWKCSKDGQLVADLYAGTFAAAKDCMFVLKYVRFAGSKRVCLCFVDS